MGVIHSSETFVTMYQSTNKGSHILSQCSAVNVRVLLYLKTVLVVAFLLPIANNLSRRQTAHCMWKLYPPERLQCGL